LEPLKTLLGCDVSIPPIEKANGIFIPKNINSTQIISFL
jgi:hypothetical protein